MRSALRLPSSDLFTRRAVAMVLVIIVHILMLLMMLRMAPAMELLDMGRKALSIELLPDQPAATQATKQTRRQRAGGAPARRAPAPEPAPDTPAPTPPPPVPNLWSTQVIPLSHDAMTSGNIAGLPAHGTGQKAGPDVADAEGTGDSDAATGPHGERLYVAEWYREPTHAELAHYLPANAPRTGWGEIACETVADYRVDNCQELGQSPPGSGLARAVRQAAWQFRVRPPRIGGRLMVGAWVRIRIDFTAADAP